MCRITAFLLFLINGILIFKYSTAIKATALIFSKNTIINQNDTKNDNSTNELISTKPVLTGIPQIDYIYDPNLPRELNGYNLSEYPFYASVPDPEEIDFKCDGLHDGFYASVPHKCQLYHHCLYGKRFDFLCANYTAFDQKTFICHFVSEVDCENSKKYWFRNDALYQQSSTAAPTTTTTLKVTSTTSLKPSKTSHERQYNSDEAKPIRKKAKKKYSRRRRPEYQYDYYNDDYYDDVSNHEYDDKRYIEETKRHRSASIPYRNKYRRPQQMYRNHYSDYYEDDIDYLYNDNDNHRYPYRNNFEQSGIKNRRFRPRFSKKPNFIQENQPDFNNYDDYGYHQNQMSERKNFQNGHDTHLQKNTTKIDSDDNVIIPKLRNGSNFNAFFSKPRPLPKILQHKIQKTSTTISTSSTSETKMTTAITPNIITTTTPATTIITTETTTIKTEPTTTTTIMPALTTTKTIVVEPQIARDEVDYYDEFLKIHQDPKNVQNTNSRVHENVKSFILPSRGGGHFESYRNLKPVGLKAIDNNDNNNNNNHEYPNPLRSFRNHDLEILFDKKSEFKENDGSSYDYDRSYYRQQQQQPIKNRDFSILYQNNQNNDNNERKDDNFSIIYDTYPLKNRNLRQNKHYEFRN